MPRYANMLAEGFSNLGYDVDIWSPKPIFFKMPVPRNLKKWMGYIDQYIIFPRLVKSRIKTINKNTLFVFSDHALGPWIPLVSNFPHVVHCHDFMAQHSAKNLIPQNMTSLSGKIYQKYIFNGYSKGKHFISVSKKTQNDLHEMLRQKPKSSYVVYNSINPNIKFGGIVSDSYTLADKLNLNLANGFILHVGGNQWYKNRRGVLLIYNKWRESSLSDMPLLLVGSKPTQELIELKEKSSFSDSILFLSEINDELLYQIYSAATMLLFPSLGEGFGWPIVEAMALNTPVITTNEAPMTEVGGDAAIYIPRLPIGENITSWTRKGSDAINRILNLDLQEKEYLQKKGIENAKRFTLENQLEELNDIYKKILLKYSIT